MLVMVMACCGRRAEFYPRGAILKPCPYRIGRGAGWGGAVGGGKDVKWLCDENCPTPVLAIEWSLVRKGEGAMCGVACSRRGTRKADGNCILLRQLPVHSKRRRETTVAVSIGPHKQQFQH